MFRRHFLLGSAALAGGLSLGLPARAAAPRRLIIAKRTLDIHGRAASVYGLTDDKGSPGLTFSPGERFSVDLANRLDEPTIIHWHGLTPPVEQDGAAIPGGVLAAGASQNFDFPIDRPGSYWMHAHTLQEQNLLAAPLIVRSTEDESADRQEVVILLHDFSFTPAQTLLTKLTHGEGHAMGGMHGMDHTAMGQAMPDMAAMGDMNGAMAMDLNDIDYDAYLANDRTLDDPEIVRVETSGRVLIRIINGAAATGFSIDAGALPATLIAVDGQPVAPLAARLAPITMGQRLDLLVDIPSGGGAFPILALREGSPHRAGVVLATPGAAIKKLQPMGAYNGPVLDLALESRLKSLSPLPDKPIARRVMTHLGGDMAAYRWSMTGAEAIEARSGDRIEIDMMNMSMMAHPMHLHGHHFQVVAIDGARISGALRDTVLVPPMRTVTIAFDAGSPGAWPFHCHHLYHMASGMMTHIRVA